MPTTTEAVKNGAAEATKKTQEAMRHYFDESAAIGRGYLSAMVTTTQANLRAAFDLQNATMQASRTMLEAMAPADYGWFDQAAQSTRKAQDATMKMVTAAFNIAESALPGSKS